MNPRARTPRPPRREDSIFVTLLRTASLLSQEADRLLKARGLSPEQYNVLRILRGAGPEGCACREIGERMISRDPDMTRLLDRLERRGWVSRERGKNDRRVVHTRITAAGLEVLSALDKPIRELHKRQFQHMSAGQLKSLARLLEEARTRVPEAHKRASNQNS